MLLYYSSNSSNSSSQIATTSSADALQPSITQLTLAFDDDRVGKEAFLALFRLYVYRLQPSFFSYLLGAFRMNVHGKYVLDCLTVVRMTSQSSNGSSTDEPCVARVLGGGNNHAPFLLEPGYRARLSARLDMRYEG